MLNNKMYKNWPLSDLRARFDRYLKEFGHYPSSDEIDSVNYLPSARQIQRLYGGLPNLRGKLGLDLTDFSRGKNRSNLGHKINNRGNKLEMVLERQLIKLFGRHFVHSERKISNTGKSRFDFYIFTRQGEVGIDVFFPTSFHSFVGIVNLKQKKYQEYNKTRVYFVCANKSICQEEIDSHINAKTAGLPGNVVVFAYKNFLEEIGSYEKLKAI